MTKIRLFHSFQEAVRNMAQTLGFLETSHRNGQVAADCREAELRLPPD